jgi:hypothetical protein
MPEELASGTYNMGQYQQWLLYREIDQKLRARLEELETEMAQLQDHARFLEQAGPDNEIIRAVAANIERNALAISETEPELPTTPCSELVLLPENVMDVLDEYSQSELQLPWWIHNIAISTDRTSPVDQQTIRTNRLIQRWIERWGRQPAPPMKQLPGEGRPA